jgi:hypothetical protein
MLGLFGLAGAEEVFQPTIHEEIRQMVVERRSMTRNELATWNQYNSQMGEYERFCGKGLAMLEAHVARDIWERVQAQVNEWDRPHHMALQDILNFLRLGYGGTYDEYRNMENRRDMDNIPYFTDHLSTIQCVNRLQRLLKERKMWDENRTQEQIEARITYVPDRNMLNCWLSERLFGDDGTVVALRREIAKGVGTFDENVAKIIGMFELKERDMAQQRAMKLRHDGIQSSAGAQNMSFAAQDEEVDRANYVGKQRFGVNVSQGKNTGDRRTYGGRGKGDRSDVCFGCGKTGHIRRLCPEARCYTCQGLGHLFIDCPIWLGSKRPYEDVRGGAQSKFSRRGSRVGGQSTQLVTIRDRGGHERGKIRKTDMAAYQGLLMDMADFKEERDRQQASGGVVNENQDEEELLYLDEVGTELHDHVMAHFGGEDDHM